jgi:O-acetyl-ADP-ribose deacetylase (regulator of RNase III)
MAYHIYIKQGDLLDDPDADFIVNPSNTVLSLGSGVSSAFARACGPELQALMTRKLHETGRLRKGDVVETGGGGCTRYRSILHAAVMDYNPGAADVMPALHDIETIMGGIESFLTAFTAHGRTPRLALPLMGTGVGGLDKRAVVRIYRDFFGRAVTFECEVTIYARSSADYAMITGQFAS